MSGELLFNSLKIENYRAFKNLDIPNLKMINLIGGRNGIGKSTLLGNLCISHPQH